MFTFLTSACVGLNGVSCPLRWLLIVGAFTHVLGQCSLPSALQGKWYRGSDGAAVTLTASGMSGHTVNAGSSAYTSFDCDGSSGSSTFVFGLPSPVDGVSGRLNGHFCWQLSKVTDTTYLLYQLTPVATEGTFADNRVVDTAEGQPTPSVSSVCSLDAASQAPTILYRLSNDADTDVDVTSLSSAVQQCPAEVFATYSYVKDGSGCLGSESSLDFCVDRQTARVNYTACNDKILFSDGGLLSCTASFTLNSATYVLLINHDSSVDNSNYFRFACMRVQTSGGTEEATIYPGDCTATSGTHLLALTRTVSCPLTDSEGTDIVPIVVGVVMAVVVVAAVVAAVVLYKKVYLKRKKRAISPSLPKANGTNGLKETTVNLGNTEPSPSGVDNSLATGEALPRSGRLPPLDNHADKSAPLRD